MGQSIHCLDDPIGETCGNFLFKLVSYQYARRQPFGVHRFSGV